MVKRKVRFTKPQKAVLGTLSKGKEMTIINRAGVSLFGDNEKDIQVGSTYGGHASGDFRCMNDRCLIGFDRPKLTTIQRCRPGHEFVVKKGNRTAKCELLWILPDGFVVEFRVRP